MSRVFSSIQYHGSPLFLSGNEDCGLFGFAAFKAFLAVHFNEDSCIQTVSEFAHSDEISLGKNDGLNTLLVLNAVANFVWGYPAERNMVNNSVVNLHIVWLSINFFLGLPLLPSKLNLDIK